MSNAVRIIKKYIIEVIGEMITQKIFDSVSPDHALTGEPICLIKV